MMIDLIHFDLNEWYTIGMILGGFAIAYFLPKKISGHTLIYSLLAGPFLGMVFDHSLAMPPLDYYDVGDGPGYPMFDIFSYIMYAPFGYLFIYFYEEWRIKGQTRLVYLFGWSFLAIVIEWASTKAGVFDYKNGYKLYYSFPVYLFVETSYLYVYSTFFRIKLIPRNRNS